MANFFDAAPESEARASLSDIVGIVGLFYIAILATVLIVGSVTGGSLGAATPALDWIYASNLTA